MSFQDVENANGQLVITFGWVIEVGTSKLNVNQKSYQQVKLRDDTGVEHNVTINKGKGRLLDETALNTRQQFNLQTYRGEYGVGYSGFWRQTQVRQPEAPSLSTEPSVPIVSGPPAGLPEAKQPSSGIKLPPAVLSKTDETKIINTATMSAKDLVIAGKIEVENMQRVATELIHFGLGGWKELEPESPYSDEPPQGKEIPF